MYLTTEKINELDDESTVKVLRSYFYFLYAKFNLLEHKDVKNALIFKKYIELDDINDELGIDLESEDYDSIAGHIINLLDHFPKAGETVQDKYAEYRVLEATNNRIDKVKVHLLPQKDTTADLDEEEGV